MVVTHSYMALLTLCPGYLDAVATHALMLAHARHFEQLVMQSVHSEAAYLAMEPKRRWFDKVNAENGARLQAFFRSPAVQRLVADPDFQAALRNEALDTSPGYLDTLAMIKLFPGWTTVLVKV